jgi:predicted TIM-barrel fold metal-dependent hydrolase
MISRRDFCLGAATAVVAGASGRRTSAKEKRVGIDCHAHVFIQGLKLADVRRYAPTYDASIADYLAMLDGNGMSHGVLIQPSFLGTDNSYLLEALRSAPDRLRGVVVVEPSISTADLKDLDRQGCVGIRLNLVGKPDPDFGQGEWPDHLARIVDVNWQIEIQAEAKRYADLLPPLLAKGATVVVDHFGLPDKTAGVADPGFQHLLGAAKSGHVWVKLSGAYRSGPDGERIAKEAYPLLRAAFGVDHLVWGSDWPHTQFESVMTPRRARQDLDDWVPDAAERETILTVAPARLFRISV